LFRSFAKVISEAASVNLVLYTPRASLLSSDAIFNGTHVVFSPFFLKWRNIAVVENEKPGKVNTRRLLDGFLREKGTFSI